MNAMQQCLKRLPDTPIGEVVHIHPLDTEVLDWSMERHARRVVASTAEPKVLEEWRRSAAGLLNVELFDTAISGHPGPAEWLRFNLSEVNGWLEPAGLRQVYPRLQLLDRVKLETLDLRGFLASIGGVSRGDRPNLLVLEVPGMETCLLAKLSPEALCVFDWILIRSAREGLFNLGEGFDAVLACLQEHFFCLEVADTQTDPNWPVSLFRFDKSAAERQAMSEEISALRSQLFQLEQRGEAALEATRKERDAQTKLAQQLARQVDELGKECAEQTEKASEREAQARALSQAKAQADKRSQDGQAAVEQLIKARDEYAKQSTDRQQRVEQLETQLDDMAARHAVLQEELIKAEAHVELISDLLFRDSRR